MLTIGTAGHIDHGKSSLVKALTSIDPDRLPEEKERGMTIDLGFAWLALPSGETVGIVDVPGHKQFVHNVIPGLFGIDAVLLVVAADDGWMPQTEEHLRILDLLGIKHGIVVLNKIDLISDPEWLSLVEKDISAAPCRHQPRGFARHARKHSHGPRHRGAKAGHRRPRQELTPRQDIGKPRLPIDRVFVIKGSGVVVTGTLSQGTFSAGDECYHCAFRYGRAHKKPGELQKSRRPGPSRVAAWPSTWQASSARTLHAEILSLPRHLYPSSRIMDVEMKLLADAGAPLKNMAEVLVYMETRELLGRVALIGAKVAQAW